MQQGFRLPLIVAALLVGLLGRAVPAWAADALEPLVYTVRIVEPAAHEVEVEVAVPAAGHASIELMMATWSPGFYRVEDYASRILTFFARSPEGVPLEVERPRPNRWRIRTAGAPTVIVSYRLLCAERSVSTNWAGDAYAVLNGPATFLTLAEQAHRPHEVRLELPRSWTLSMTGLPVAPDGLPHHYRAVDFDALADSPILAGALGVQEFEVEGSKHFLVSAGERESWDAQRAVVDVKRMVEETRRFWGFLPFQRYLFLIVFRQGGGGLEHANSTLLTGNPTRIATPEGYRAWLGLVSHEYFHAFNVKRLRPIELGPFDYETPAHSVSLWIAEGLTSYFDELCLRRGGLSSPEEFLASLSALIRKLQESPGRLLQTLEQSSLGVWTNSLSGINPDENTVSYYIKGQVVGFLLDAKIRRATQGVRALDDAMRLAYARHSGDRGFTPAEFRGAAEETAGQDLEEWFQRAVASTADLDYGDALEWFGLRFAGPNSGEASKSWTLEVRSDATAGQRSHLQGWLGQAPTH